MTRACGWRKDHGCSVHYVSAELDGGPIIAQAEVPVLPGDTPKPWPRACWWKSIKLYPKALGAGRIGSFT